MDRPGMCARAEDGVARPAMRPEQSLGHLRAGGIMRAQEQHALGRLDGVVCHGSSSLADRPVSASCTCSAGTALA